VPEAPHNSVQPETRADWRSWLEQNHTQAEGVWFAGYKKSSGKPRLDYGDAVEEALCFGWIDSKPRKLDDERSMLWFAPRRPRSGWSRQNKERAERMIATGRMTQAGLIKIEAAKQDGSWSMLDSVEALEIPADLDEAFATHSEAKRHFDAFPRSVKRGILEWIATAKKPETRARRVEETARLAADGIRANQWRR
jgi:uncharacterized protein YdeI (YjbR/CyaY-like superfamily)